MERKDSVESERVRVFDRRTMYRSEESVGTSPLVRRGRTNGPASKRLAIFSCLSQIRLIVAGEAVQLGLVSVLYQSIQVICVQLPLARSAPSLPPRRPALIA